MIDNKFVQEAEKELEYLNGDEEARRLAELREKAIRDEAAAIAGATRRGREEGRAEGRKEGKIQEKIQIAKNMLAENCDVKFIMKVTGLTKEQIEKL